MSLALAFIVGVTALIAGRAVTSKSSPPANNAGIVLGSETDLRVSDYNFNDAGTGYRDVWSAAKIESFLNKNSPVYASSDCVPGNVVFFGAGSELVDKGIVIDDNKKASFDVVWTSAKIKSSISDMSDQFMNKVPEAKMGNLCIFDNAGQVVDTGKKINDSGSSTSDIWTASKILNIVNPKTQMKLVPTAAPKTVAIFDAVGQVRSSGKTIDDTASPGPTVMWTSQKTAKAVADAAAAKMSLVSGAKARDWAMFDGTGQIVDSGSALNDNGKTVADIWSASKIQSVVDAAVVAANNSAASALADQTAECLASIDAAKAVNDTNANTLNALSVDLKTKMNLVPTAKNSAIAVFDGSGQAVDSKVAFNDAGTTSTDIWSADKISSSIAAVKASIDSQLANQSSQQTASNTAIQNQIASLTQQETDLSALLKTKMDLVPTAQSGNVGIFNGAGQAVDGGFALNDLGSGASVIWSSAKMKSSIDASASESGAAISTSNSTIAGLTTSANGKMILQPSAKKDAVAVFDGAGQAVASAFFVNDAGTTASDLWTASKTTAEIATRVSYTGTPVVNNLAMWTSASGVGDAKMTIDDSKTTTSNLWTAAQTKSYWDAEMLKTYSNKCWFTGKIDSTPTVGSTLQAYPFRIWSSGTCGATVGTTVSSVPITKTGLYLMTFSASFRSADSVNGKILLFRPVPTRSLTAQIYIVNGFASVYFATAMKIDAGTVFSLSLQFVNADGTTPASGGSAMMIVGTGEHLSVQEM